MSHRLECGMPISGLKMAVIVQVNNNLSIYPIVTRVYSQVTGIVMLYGIPYCNRPTYFEALCGLGVIY